LAVRERNEVGSLRQFYFDTYLNIAGLHFTNPTLENDFSFGVPRNNNKLEVSDVNDFANVLETKVGLLDAIAVSDLFLVQIHKDLLSLKTKWSPRVKNILF